MVSSGKLYKRQRKKAKRELERSYLGSGEGESFRTRAGPVVKEKEPFSPR